MQEKYKQLVEKMLQTLQDKFLSRKEAEEVFGQIGEVVLIKTMNDFLAKIGDKDDRKNFMDLMEKEKYEDAYDVLAKYNIDFEKVFQENFWELYEEVLAV